MNNEKVKALPLYPVVVYTEDGGTCTGICAPEMDVEAAMKAAEVAAERVGAVDPLLAILPVFVDAKDMTPEVLNRAAIALKLRTHPWMVRKDLKEKLQWVHPEEVEMDAAEG